MSRRTARMILIAERGGLGGAQRLVEYLEHQLEARDWEVEWLTPAALGPIRQSRRYPGLNEAFRTLAMAKALRRLPSVDLSISHGTYGMGARGRRIHTYHGIFAALIHACRAGASALDYLVARWVIGSLEQWSGLGATRVVVSQRVRRELRGYYGLNCNSVLHNGVDADHFVNHLDRGALRRAFGLPEEEFLAVVVGRMDYGKGREVLERLQPQFQGRLVLAAPSASRAEKLVEGGAVLIPGVPYDRLPHLYRACDVLLSPSLYEGFGLTLLEAWASSRPVVTGRVGVVEELEHLDPSFTQCVTEVGDAAALATALNRLAADPELRGRQAEWGRNLVTERFALPQFGRRWMELIDGTDSGPGHRAAG